MRSFFFDSMVADGLKMSVARSDAVAMGRAFYSLYPVIRSLIDTVFWCDWYKSLAHVLLFAYSTWWGVCGWRFLTALLFLHIAATVRSPQKCTEVMAVRYFNHFMHSVGQSVDWALSYVLKFGWTVIFIIILDTGLFFWGTTTLSGVLEAALGFLCIGVLSITWGLVNPRHTIGYQHRRAEQLQAEVRHYREPDSPSSSSAVPPIPSTPSDVQLELGCTSSEACLTPASSRGKFSPSVTASAPWDQQRPCLPTVPSHMHKALTLFAVANSWTDWKTLPKESLRSRCHPVPWCPVRVSLNMATVSDVSFDQCVRFFSDDLDQNRPVEQLNIWRYEKILGEYRRLQYKADEGSIVLHVLYKQMIFGVAPREVALYTTKRELTPQEIEHYGMYESHANNFFPEPGNRGRVFISCSAPAEGVKGAAGHVRCNVYRQAVIVRDLPAAGVVELVLMISGDAGGNVPVRLTELARGEHMNILRLMRKEIAKV